MFGTSTRDRHDRSHSFRRAPHRCVAVSRARRVQRARAPRRTSREPDAARAAQTFAQLADSVTRNGGDADVGSAYSGIAGILRMGGRVTPIVLTIDGTATTFIAAAMTTETTINDARRPCSASRPPRTFVDPQPHRVGQGQSRSASCSSPRRRTTSRSARSSIRRCSRSTRAMASLIYMDGAGGTYIGTSGTQKFDVDEERRRPAARADRQRQDRDLRGRTARARSPSHTVTFSGKVEPSPFLLASNTAKAPHSIAMSAQTVAGTRHAITITYPRVRHRVREAASNRCPTPPVVVRPSNELPAKLGGQRGQRGEPDVHRGEPVQRRRSRSSAPSGQKYDFVVIDSATRPRGVALVGGQDVHCRRSTASPCRPGARSRSSSGGSRPARGCTSCAACW